MIIHIGYPKTGTTFLQKNVFPFIKGIEFVTYEECRKIFKSLYSSTSLEFDEAMIKAFQIQKGQLYSLERLTGEMRTGTYNAEIAHGLKKLGFRKVIITIRRQDKIIESIYRQYIQQGGVLKSKNFIAESEYFR